MTVSYLCPACEQGDLRIFFELQDVPVHQNLLMPTRQAAQACDRGTITLGHCTRCDFISNVTFQPELLKYSTHYDNAQYHSPLFQKYMTDLATGLVQRHQLYDKSLIEVGCGQGQFLMMLCQMGNNQGLGFDPAYVGKTDLNKRVTIIPDIYSEKYAHYQADFIYARHVFEHIPYPNQPITVIRKAIGNRPQPLVFIEVPDITWILRNLIFWDIFYEHCSYFSPRSLSEIFVRSGFGSLNVYSAFGDQYLHLEARPDAAKGKTHQQDRTQVGSLTELVNHFVDHYPQKMETLRQRLQSSSARESCRPVIWGAGAKGVTLLNTLNIQPEHVPFVVDINPEKQGKFIAGTGQEIISPNRLKEYKADIIFAMNPNYKIEIQNIVAGMGLEIKIESV